MPASSPQLQAYAVCQPLPAVVGRDRTEQGVWAGEGVAPELPSDMGLTDR